MTTLSDTVRMSHKDDPHTSKEAAAKVTKKALLYEAILATIEYYGPITPGEVSAYFARDAVPLDQWPDADLYDLRRRMTELDKDLHRIEPIQVGTHKDGSPQYMTRAGQRVMRLVEETNK